ncbi:MAG: ABC transporter ATP-binding protein [Acutalibacteraceae bacterium]
MKHLGAYFKKYKLQSICAPFFKCLEACFDLAVPLIVAQLIDEGINTGGEPDKPYILKCFFMLILMAVLGLFSSFTAQYFAAKAAIGTATGLRHQLLNKIQSLSVSRQEEIGTATLITRLTGDLNLVQNGINMFLRLFMRSPFIVFGAMILSFTVNRKLALIFVAAITVLFIIVFGIMLLTNPLYKKVQKNLDSVTAETGEALNGVRVIRAFSREKAKHSFFEKINERLYLSQLKVGRISALLNPLTYVTVNLAIVAVLYLGGKQVENGSILSGDIIALINYIGQILIELVKLASLIALLARSAVSMGRVGQILDMENGMDESGTKTGSDENEIVRFENVSFKYGGASENSLENISFSVKKGETVGIIGGTGSGKTTLVNLLSRFYDATEGTVYLKGEDIRRWDKNALNKTVAVALQKAVLFKGTVKSNLLWGNSDAFDEQLWEALTLAQAADFVKEKQGGLESAVEQKGANLSGGQKQRLAVARALVKKSEILILDDSSSALDYATDAALRKAIKTLDNTTVFIVSQRTNSVCDADKILVLDDGMLVGAGTHNELLSSCEIYREIEESQHKKGDE